MARFSTAGLVTAAILGAAFAVGSVINSYLPTRSDILLEPFPVAGEIAQPVEIRTGRVSADNVRAASEISQFGRTAKTPGVFALVDLTFDTNGEAPIVAPISWVGGDGKEYGGSQPGPRINNCGSAQVGLPVTCTVVIEMPPTALAGGKLAVYASPSNGGDSYALIDLKITAEQAEALIADAKPVEIETTRYLGRKP